MDKILEAAAKVLLAAKNNVMGTLAVCLLVVILMAGGKLWGVIENISSHFPSSATESERFNKVIVAQNEINELLESERTIMNGDRIIIRQFHNGRQDLTGLPFTSISTTFVKMKPGVEFPENGYDAVPLSTMNDLVLKIWDNPRTPNCVKIYTKDLHGSYQTYVKNAAVDHFYACPITNLLNYPVGIIMISYMSADTQHPSDEVIFTHLRIISQKISGYMLSVTKKETTPWIFSK